MHVGLHGEDFGRGIHQHGDVPAAGSLGHHARSQRSVVARSAEDVAQGGAFVEGRFEFGLVVDDDQFDAQHADGVIVDVVRVGRKDGFALQAGKVRETLHALRIAAGDGGGGEMRNGGAAARGDDAPLGAGQLGEALADAIHQLVHVDETARGLVHGALDFGKRLRAGDDGERAAGVDDGPYADGAIHIGAELERRGHRVPHAAAQRLHRRKQSTLPEEIPAAVTGPWLFEV